MVSMGLRKRQAEIEKIAMKVVVARSTSTRPLPHKICPCNVPRYRPSLCLALSALTSHLNANLLICLLCVSLVLWPLPLPLPYLHTQSEHRSSFSMCRCKHSRTRSLHATVIFRATSPSGGAKKVPLRLWWGWSPMHHPVEPRPPPRLPLWKPTVSVAAAIRNRMMDKDKKAA